jgi:hypothetical protein
MDETELTDRLELQQLLASYAEAIDAKRWDDLDHVFTPDATLDYTSSAGPKARGSYQEMKAWLRQMLDTGMFPMTQHLLGLPLISVTGDTATCRTSYHNPMGVATDDEGYYAVGGTKLHVFVVGGWYNDRCIRTAAGWRIAEKIELQAFTTGGFPPMR